MKIIPDRFLLTNKTAEKLYFEYAEKMPVIDYHSHLPPKDIAENRQFKSITEIWLGGDHYKWRAMRTNGIPEERVTGNAPDYDKFLAWAETLPYTVRNPLYHWSYLELSRYFGIHNTLLNPDTARSVYDRCNALLSTEAFSVRNLLKRMRVEIVCTTDDPVDSLEYHKKIREDGFETKVLPTFRPDKGMAVDQPAVFTGWVEKLEKASGKSAGDYQSFISAIRARHEYFHQMGCRISDHGIEVPYGEDYSEKEIIEIYKKARDGAELKQDEILRFKSAMMMEFGRMDAEKGWTQQLHIGALRNNNSQMIRKLGPDTGFDSIADRNFAYPLSRFLDKLNSENRLPKTILYNLNPRDNEVMATMAGNFQDGSIPGKIQFGAAWWFLDQKDGMEKHLNAHSSLGLLSRFVGMLTDSRSFLSYPRHEYFRRILCNLIGKDAENGEIFEDLKTLGKIVRAICYENALNYFKF